MHDSRTIVAIVLSFAIALLITLAMWFGNRRFERRQYWLAATALTAALIVVGVIDLLGATPRETPFTTVILGAAIPVYGVAGFIRATRRWGAWLQLPLTYGIAIVLLYGGLLLGATIVPRWFIF